MTTFPPAPAAKFGYDYVNRETYGTSTQSRLFLGVCFHCDHRPTKWKGLTLPCFRLKRQNCRDPGSGDVPRLGSGFCLPGTSLRAPFPPRARGRAKGSATRRPLPSSEPRQCAAIVNTAEKPTLGLGRLPHRPTSFLPSARPEPRPTIAPPPRPCLPPPFPCRLVVQGLWHPASTSYLFRSLQTRHVT